MLVHLADEIRVKKTDLPVLPPAEISNPINDDLDDISSDDNDSNYSKDNADDADDNDDDEDDLLADDEEDEMAADEAAATGDDANAEYDSVEDNYEEDSGDNYDQQGSSSGAKPSSKNINNNKDEQKSISVDGGLSKSNADLSMPPTTGQPTPDPYFTHFDPHYEHQSYKVSQKVSVFPCPGIFFNYQNQINSKKRKPNSASRSHTVKRSPEL